MGATHVRSLGAQLELAVGAKYVVRAVETVGHTENKDRVVGIRADAPSQRYNLVLRKTAKYVASMSIQAMPGCCGVVLFYNFS
mgnify:FL=1